MAALVEWLSECLPDVTHPVFDEVAAVKDAKLEAMGDGQVTVISDTNRAIITLETRDGQHKTLPAILKAEATGAGKGLAEKCDVFTTEIKMYSKVLKSMENLMSEVGDNELLWPQCYHCGDNKFLFQDLCATGFKIVPTYKFLDVDHAMLTVKALGKFHGLAMVLKERSVMDFSNMKPVMFGEMLPFMVKWQRDSLGSLARTIDTSWGPEWSSVPAKLTKFVENVEDKLLAMYESSKGKWEVLNHGDFTMRNMLFHYAPSSYRPDDIKFVDFQMCHYSTLGMDLGTILYSSLLPKVREDNLVALLSAYRESLVATCLVHRFTGPLPTVEDVTASLHSISYLNTVNSLAFLPFFVASGKMDVQKMSDAYFGKNLGEGKEMEQTGEIMDMEMYKDEDVEKLIKFELETCIKSNIL